MSNIKKNIVANFLGRGWSMIMGLVFVPFYIRFLGTEAYGLVGFYAVLQASLGLLDLGLNATINRELARFSIFPEKSNEARDLAKTLEIIYWIIGIAIFIAVLFTASWISRFWI